MDDVMEARGMLLVAPTIRQVNIRLWIECRGDDREIFIFEVSGRLVHLTMSCVTVRIMRWDNRGCFSLLSLSCQCSTID